MRWDGMMHDSSYSASHHTSYVYYIYLGIFRWHICTSLPNATSRSLVALNFSHVVSIPVEECMLIHYHLVWHLRVTAAWTTLVSCCTFSSKPDFPPVLGIVEKKVDPKTKCKCGGHESPKHAHHLPLQQIKIISAAGVQIVSFIRRASAWKKKMRNVGFTRKGVSA